MITTFPAGAPRSLGTILIGSALAPNDAERCGVSVIIVIQTHMGLHVMDRTTVNTISAVSVMHATAMTEHLMITMMTMTMTMMMEHTIAPTMVVTMMVHTGAPTMVVTMTMTMMTMMMGMVRTKMWRNTLKGTEKVFMMRTKSLQQQTAKEIANQESNGYSHHI